MCMYKFVFSVLCRLWSWDSYPSCFVQWHLKSCDQITRQWFVQREGRTNHRRACQRWWVRITSTSYLPATKLYFNKKLTSYVLRKNLKSCHESVTIFVQWSLKQNWKCCDWNMTCSFLRIFLSYECYLCIVCLWYMSTSYKWWSIMIWLILYHDY